MADWKRSGPAVARLGWAGATAAGVSWLGFFYTTNIAGAVIGSLAAGFYLLRVFDVGITTYVAVTLNALAAVTAWWLSSRTPVQGQTPRQPSARCRPGTGPRCSAPSRCLDAPH